MYVERVVELVMVVEVGETVGLEWGSLLGNETIIFLGHQLKQSKCKTKAYAKNEKMEEKDWDSETAD